MAKMSDCPSPLGTTCTDASCALHYPGYAAVLEEQEKQSTDAPAPLPSRTQTPRRDLAIAMHQVTDRFYDKHKVPHSSYDPVVLSITLSHYDWEDIEFDNDPRHHFDLSRLRGLTGQHDQLTFRGVPVVLSPRQAAGTVVMRTADGVDHGVSVWGETQVRP